MTTPKKRLFIVRDKRGQPVKGDDGNIVCFDNKMAAKKFRDSIPDAVVSPGPDHWKHTEGDR